MPNFYAQIDNNGVVHTVSALRGEVDNPNCIPILTYDITLIGKKYTGTEFINVPRVPNNLLNNKDFWDRFTDEEQEAVASSGNSKVEWFIADLTLKNNVDLSSNRIKNFINLLEANNIIAEGRAAQILEIK